MNKKTLIDFWADWCRPCKAMNPIIDQIVEEFPGQVVKIDIEADLKEPQRHGVMSVPTYLIMDGDKEVKRFVGITSKEKLVEAMRE